MWNFIRCLSGSCEMTIRFSTFLLVSEVWLMYSKRPRSKVLSSVCCNNRMYPHNHHLKEELEHFHHPESSRGKFCGKLLICVAEHLPVAVCTISISRSLALVSHLEGQAWSHRGGPCLLSRRSLPALLAGRLRLLCRATGHGEVGSAG